MKILKGVPAAMLVIAVTSVLPSPPASADTGVTRSRLLAATQDTSNWLSYGRDYHEQRFVPLDQINDANVGQLGLAWHADLPTPDGFSATPLVIDGRIYMTAAFANVFALDARTGEVLWHSDRLRHRCGG
jgi:quinohemoprotein ethanol dehydrogenase